MVLGVAEFVGGHEPWAEAARALEILAEAELPVVALEFAHRALVVAAIARDMAQGARDRNVAARRADDHGELALVIEGLRDFFVGAPQRIAMADDADRHALEDLRIIGRGGEARLVDMRLEIQRQ